MDIQELLCRTNYLLRTQYGFYLGDDEEMATKALQDGEEPQAIVDEIAENYGLTRIPGTLGETHVESLVIQLKENLTKQFGKEYSNQVSDDSLKEWLKAGKEPESVPEMSEEELNDLAAFIEDNL